MAKELTNSPSAPSSEIDIKFLPDEIRVSITLVGDKWLMLMEIYEAALLWKERKGDCGLPAAVRAELLALRKVSAEQRFLIDEGLARVKSQLAATA